MTVLAESVRCRDEDVSGPERPRFLALFECEPATLNEGDCYVLGAFGLGVTMDVVDGMIKSFNDH